MKKIGFVTFEKYQGKKNIGSTRIRARWVMDKINELYPDQYFAEEHLNGKAYDVLVFQKAYWLEMAKAFKGLKILDLCDPDWMQWEYQVKQMIDEVDVITTSSEALKNFVANLTEKPIYFIPDRLKLETIKERKKHRGDLQTVAWYGYNSNFEVIDWAIQALNKRKLKLIVVSDKAYRLPTGIKNVELTNYKWTEDTVNGDLLRADAILNPPMTKGRFKFKSNNKTTLAWSLGLPVLETDEDFDIYKSADVRNSFAENIQEEINSNYDVKDSAKELIGIIETYAEPQGTN